MGIFLRQQLSPYCISTTGDDDNLIPAIRYSGPTPHGCHEVQRIWKEPGGGWEHWIERCWGPDEFGYTDFDDYHLAIYGA